MSKETALVTTRMDPQALIAKAIETGANVETLERLVTLAKDIRQVTAREAWYEAIAEFQRRCPAIKKDSTARIATRTGGSYSYSYAALDTILAIVQPLLGELGLSLSWRQKHEAQAVAASCVVAHKLGHQEDSGFIAMPYGGDDGRMNPAQRVGSALTYARRYSLLAILGLAPEDDDDAQGVGNGDTQRARERSPQAERGSTRVGEPPHVPGDPAAPVSDPEAHRAESEALFPDPQIAQERERLLGAIKTKADALKMPVKQRAQAWLTYIGDGIGPDQADPAALADLLKWLEARGA